MIHPIYIDDTTVAEKRFMNENQSRRKSIEFADPAATGIIPDGYMTSEVCKQKVITGLKKRLQENGFL